VNQIRAVLIITYARPEGVRRLLHSCVESEIESVYISLDGPKDSKVVSIQTSILQVVSEFSSRLNISVSRLDSNYGVGVGVIKALDWFFQNVDQGVILEDDLQVSPDFLPFIFSCLEDDSLSGKVKMISGTRVFPTGYNGLSTSYYPMIWGWGTWARSWQVMRQAIIEPKKLSSKYLLSPEYWFWRIGADRVLNGSVDTWDTPLAYEFFTKKWLCAYPPVNLVSNLGFDAVAAHTTSQIFPLGLPLEELLLQNLDLKRIELDTAYTKKLRNDLFKVRRRHLLLWLWSCLNDSKLFPKMFRKEPLIQRLQTH
jgi:hypothetical protein